MIRGLLNAQEIADINASFDANTERRGDFGEAGFPPARLPLCGRTALSSVWLAPD